MPNPLRKIFVTTKTPNKDAGKKQKVNIKSIMKGSLFPLISILVWELLEELVEEGIAWTISSLFAKMFSIVGIVFVTQTLKYALSRLVKVLTYRKGQDKTLMIRSLLLKIRKRRKRMSLKKLSKTQIVTLVVGLLGAIYGVLSVFIPEVTIVGDQLISTIAGLGIASVSGLVGTFKGYADKTADEVSKAKERELKRLEKIELAEKKLLADKKIAEELAVPKPAEKPAEVVVEKPE